MMSAKWKDFDSEAGSAAFQVRRPSVRVPSTSKAMAWRVWRGVGSKGIGSRWSGWWGETQVPFGNDNQKSNDKSNKLSDDKNNTNDDKNKTYDDKNNTNDDKNNTNDDKNNTNDDKNNTNDDKNNTNKEEPHLF